MRDILKEIFEKYRNVVLQDVTYCMKIKNEVLLNNKDFNGNF